jgi:hypothetical protein
VCRTLPGPWVSPCSTRSTPDTGLSCCPLAWCATSSSHQAASDR